MRSSSTISILNALDLVRYKPLPITVAVIPVPLNSACKLPSTVSTVTAVSASNGVGAGRIALMLALTAIAS